MDQDFPIDSQNIPSQIPEEHHNIPVSGLFENWYLDYASEVNLDRAVPYLDDGLKPVQRRILHAMYMMEDGRYNKVANIIGQTMQYHPHGDASIGDALVNIGQKGLLIDAQGNWGNIFTGDGAAAPRYIEARLTKFAMEVVFNPKITKWKLSYDGRKKEPISLPIKFPLLLAQGAEGIGVGLATKILPHNFNELIEASIAFLKDQPFVLYPDFPTGGQIDVSKYNDGQRGGKIRIRANIKKIDSKNLVITEIPYGKTSSSIIDSIIKANDKGKIKIKKVNDNTSDKAEIEITLAPGISPDMTIDALYACTDCETSISTDSCVIDNRLPHLMGVSDILKISTLHTKDLLKQELEVRLNELEEDWHYSSLEKIFFEQRIYRELEKNSVSWEAQLKAIEEAFIPYISIFKRPITRDDIIKLTDKPVRKISKFDIKKVDDHILAVEKEIAQVLYNIEHLVGYTIKWFTQLQKKYGTGKERRTEIRSFDVIEASKVVIANEKLYVNRQEGMVGTSLKKDEYICDCSDIDDIIVIRKDGSYIIKKVSEKDFLGKDIIHIAVFKKNDKRTIYNVIYRHGRTELSYVKRCAISGITRDKEYNLTKGEKGSQILYLSVNPNGESEVLKVVFRPKPRLKSLTMEVDLGQVSIKGRDSQGNIFSKHAIHKIQLKEKGNSTLGGQKVWYESDIQRLNFDGRGELIDVFDTHDKLLVVTKNGLYRVTGCDTTYRLEDDLLLLRKHQPSKVFTAVYKDNETQFYYLKRFVFESIDKGSSFLLAESDKASLIHLTERKHPIFQIVFGGSQATRPAETIEAENFIAIKSFRAKGKRLTTYEVSEIIDISPEDPEEEPINDVEEIDQTEGASNANNQDLPLSEESSESKTDKYPEIDMEINRNGEPEQMSLF